MHDSVERFLDEVLASGVTPPEPLPTDVFRLPELTEAQKNLVDAYSLEFFRRLAQRIAHFHTIMAGLEEPAFAPEPITKLYLRALYQTMRTLAYRTAQGVERLLTARDRESGKPGKLLPNDLIEHCLTGLLHMEPTGICIRTHGDLQLDNVLHLGKDFMLVDFGGDVRLPLGERAIKRPALRDTACMIISMGITAEKSLRQHLERNPPAAKELTGWLGVWRRYAGLSFYEAYREAVRGTPLIPRQEETTRQLLKVFLLEQLLRNVNRSLEEAPDDVPALLELTELLMRVFP